MSAFWFSAGCIVGVIVAMVVFALMLGLCRAAATGDPDSEYFMNVLDGPKK